SFPTHSTPGLSLYFCGHSRYRHTTTLYNPNRHGAARKTVSFFLPRVVSNPTYERISSNVVSTFQRRVYVSTISLGFIPTSVLEKYSSRCVPLRSRTYTQRTSTSPCPGLYH